MDPACKPKSDINFKDTIGTQKMRQTARTTKTGKDGKAMDTWENTIGDVRDF